MQIDIIINWNSDFPLFTGKYKDLDPAWYTDVGSTIIFYMIINIFTPHFASLFSYLIMCCKRGCDKKKSKNKTTAKLTKTEYLELYVGPEFLLGSRYAEVICTIFIVLLYSSGMPILYVCCLLYLFVIYWIDKYLILRFYRTPPNTDFYNSSFFSQLILFAIIVHCCFGIWTYGNFDIFYDTTSFQNSYFVKDYIKKYINSGNKFITSLVDRILLPHNLILFGVLVIFTIIFLYKLILKKILIYALCLNFCDCNCSKRSRLKSKKLFDGKLNTFIVLFSFCKYFLFILIQKLCHLNRIITICN